MRVQCPLCNKSFANKNSLYTHKNKYHANMDENEKTIKRHYSSEDMSEQSEDESTVHFKRMKTEKSHNETVSKLVRVVAGLIREMKQVSKNFREIGKDMDEVEDKINENKRNINREIMFNKQMDGSGIDMDIKRFYKKNHG